MRASGAREKSKGGQIKARDGRESGWHGACEQSLRQRGHGENPGPGKKPLEQKAAQNRLGQAGLLVLQHQPQLGWALSWCLVTSGHIWSHLVIPGQICSHLLTPGQIWSHVITPGHTSHLVTPGHTMSHLVTSTHTCSYLVLPGHIWLHLFTPGQISSHLVTPGDIWLHLLTPGLLIPGHTCSYLVTSGHCSHLLTPHIWSHLVTPTHSSSNLVTSTHTWSYLSHLARCSPHSTRAELPGQLSSPGIPWERKPSPAGRAPQTLPREPCRALTPPPAQPGDRTCCTSHGHTWSSARRGSGLAQPSLTSLGRAWS